MGKNKKKAKRPKYPHVISIDYLDAVSQRLWEMNPSKQIVFNTVKDVWEHGWGKGYDRKHEETVRFKQKRAKAFDDEFKEFTTYIDDIIHTKGDNTKPSFEDWKKTQRELQKEINKSKNQPTK
jgi:hypothetical protein